MFPKKKGERRTREEEEEEEREAEKKEEIQLQCQCNYKFSTRTAELFVSRDTASKWAGERKMKKTPVSLKN